MTSCHGGESVSFSHTFMPTPKMMKTVFGKVNRSGFHHLVIPVLPVDRTPEAGLDVLGGVTIVSLSAGVLLLMRLVLAN
jgi:hypothetical protein